MNTASTLIAIVPEADLAAVTGGVDWVVSAACWVAATFVDAVLSRPGRPDRPFLPDPDHLNHHERFVHI